MIDSNGIYDDVALAAHMHIVDNDNAEQIKSNSCCYVIHGESGYIAKIKPETLDEFNIKSGSTVDDEIYSTLVMCELNSNMR